MAEHDAARGYGAEPVQQLIAPARAALPRLTQNLSQNRQDAVFRYTQNGVTVTKTVTLHPRNYKVDVRTALENARRDRDVWRARLSDAREVSARALVNAAGPWVADVLARLGVDAAAAPTSASSLSKRAATEAALARVAATASTAARCAPYCPTATEARSNAAARPFSCCRPASKPCLRSS